MRNDDAINAGNMLDKALALGAEGLNPYDDGRRLEVQISPDGRVVDRREFTVTRQD